ncbi:hypothetical protein MMC06_004206 [Schaereria dolodes]|nr:hypothetical protein [Schaereria dolodes]
MVELDVTQNGQHANGSILTPLESAERAAYPPYLRLQLPETSQCIHSDSGESDEDDHTVQDEDVSSILGISISREQTRLMLLQAPAAEKAAVIDGIANNGLFNHSNQDSIEYCGQGDQEVGKYPAAAFGFQKRTQWYSAELPSPWTATPQLFERIDAGHDSRHAVRSRSKTFSGSTSMLADLNVKRFLSSFNLPSLPKSPSFKDLPIPSLPSILGGLRDLGDSHDGSKPVNRSKRSSSLFASNFTFGSLSQHQKRVPRTLDGLSDRVSANSKMDPVSFPPTSRPETSSISNDGHNLVRTGASGPYPLQQRYSHLRRSTSDQSSELRRAVSTTPSLGDDSRWENVQEQVNSRFKAIIDSFQDSSIRLPSIPSIHNLSFSALRPDFTYKRASSADKPHVQGFETNSGPDATDRALKSQRQGPAGVSAHNNARKLQKSVHPYFDKAVENLTGDVVVLGGYRGSILRSAKPPHRQLWVPVKVGLNIRKVNLEVGLEVEDEENMEEHIFASGMLTHIGPVDISRRLLKRLRACRNAQEGRLQVHDYGYDWRLSPHLLSRKFIEFLDRLPCNTLGKPQHQKGATIIAHSLGGLITRHAVNCRPELFAGIVYAGVPQHCVNILGPLRKGDEVLLSSRVLTAQVNFTLRTSFLLLPEDGRCFVDKHTKEEYHVDFFSVAEWKEHCFSPCIAPALPALNSPEKKGILGSVSGSLSSLPLAGKKLSGPFISSKGSEAKSTITHAADTATTKVENVANTEDPALSMQMDNNSQPPASSTLPLAAALAYLRRTLASTLLFRSELAFNPSHVASNAYPPISVLYSTSVPTVCGAKVSSRDGIRRMDAYDDLAFASGDGVCLARAAMVPKGYQICDGGRVKTERGHVGLLGDLEGVGRCLVAVGRARRMGVGTGLGQDKIG